MIGAHVIAGAASEEKRAFVRAQGADQAIDYTAEEWRKTLAAMTGGRPIDVVFDAVGGRRHLTHSLPYLGVERATSGRGLRRGKNSGIALKYRAA